MKNNLIAPLETKTTAAIQIEIRRRKCARLLIPLLACVILGTPAKTAAQTFATYPAGDDVTPSLGQFQIVLDQAWVKIFDVIIPNSPLGSVLSTKHIKLCHKGVITSPTANWITLVTNVAASNPVVFVDNDATNGLGFCRVGRLPNP